MISLLVDEGYAFDYLSILEVKNKLHPSVTKQETYLECFNYLKNQLDNFDNIYNSTEYKDLLQSNIYTFNLIDKLRNGELVTAKEIDDANMERFHKKKSLQNTFFRSVMKEEKIV
jgi:hypothetical protein